MAQKELKIVFSGDTTVYRKEVDKAALATNKLKSDAGSAMSDLAGVFGISIKEIKGNIDDMSKGFTMMLTSMKASTEGATIVSGAMNIIKLALVSTGIGALVVAFGSLVAYFTQTREGANFVKQVMASLGAAVRVVVDHFSSFGEGIVKLFKGDWSGAATAFRASVTGIGTDMINAGKSAADLEKRTQALNKVERESAVANSEKLAQAADLREKAAEKETYDAATRKKYLLEAKTLIKDVADEEGGIAKERLNIFQAQMALHKVSSSDLQEEANLKMRVFEIDRNSSMEQKALMKQMNGVNNEINAQTEALKKKAQAERDAIMGEKPKQAYANEVTVDTKLGDTGGLKAVQRIKDQMNSARIATEDATSYIAKHTLDLSNTLNGAWGGAADGFGQFLGNLMSGKSTVADFGSFVATQFADLAVTVGKQMIAFGATGIALKMLIKNPWLALAAGVALVALGTAAKASISSSISGGGANSAASSGSNGATNEGYQNPNSVNGAKTMSSVNVTVGGQFTLQNGVLVAAVNQEQQRINSVT